MSDTMRAMRFGSQCAICGDEVAPPRTKYCSDDCSKAYAQANRPSRAKPAKVCARPDCKNHTKGQRAFCSSSCAKLVAADVEAPESLADADLNPRQARSGRGYEMFVRDGWARQIADGLVTATQVAAIKGIDPVQVTRWVNTYWEQVKVEGESAGWEMTEEALAGLEDFEIFREMVFVTETGEKYVTKPFHKRWIDAILETIRTGGRLQILSPPRHGKTQLLIHFCIWLIVRNPHIRILWISASKELAERWLARSPEKSRPFARSRGGEIIWAEQSSSLSIYDNRERHVD